MKVIHYEQIPSTPVDSEGASGCRIRCLIGTDDHAPASPCGSSRLPRAEHAPARPRA